MRRFAVGASQNRYLPKSLTADEIMGGVGYSRPEFGSPLERSGSALLLMRIMLMAFLLVAGLGGSFGVVMTLRWVTVPAKSA